MNRLLLLDAQNYGADLPEIRRVAVRGVIWIGGKLLLNESRFGELKLPGGGQEDGEDDRETLLREVREETGFAVRPESLRPFGYIEEKRLSLREPTIWHQFSRLYFCEVAGEQGARTLTESERKRGFHPGLYTLDEAIAQNRRVLNREGAQPWNQRELQTLLLIRERLRDGEIIPVDETNVNEAGIVHALAWQESHRLFCTAEFVAKHTPERQTEYLRTKRAAGAKVFLLVTNRPVGVVSVTGSCIEDLYILPDEQGRGLGTRLLRFAMGQCPDTPTLWILENNDGARRLYERMGFQATGRRNRITDELDEIEFRLETEREEAGTQSRPLQGRMRS